MAMINAASDMNESMSKMNVVFGDSAKECRRLVKDSSAKNIGHQPAAAVEAAGTYGNLFTALGLGKAPAADMSTSLVNLAGDLASFNNASPEEVLNWRCAPVCLAKTEPLKKYRHCPDAANHADKSDGDGDGRQHPGIDRSAKDASALCSHHGPDHRCSRATSSARLTAWPTAPAS